MLGRFRNALYNAIGSIEQQDGANASTATNGTASAGAGARSSGATASSLLSANGAGRVKYPYQRPVFLHLFTEDEVQVTADHWVRPIMVPRDVTVLPWYTGYAEAINAGKSLRNEDQAAFHRGVLRMHDLDEAQTQQVRDTADLDWELPYVYFAIFDGHAGSGCAVAASNELHAVLHRRLLAILHHLVPPASGSDKGATSYALDGASMWFPTRDISAESLIIGALESAFWEMDQQIGEDKKRYKMLGGCTVLVSLFILGKLYVANAGDSRGVLCRDGVSYPMSFDFTPVSERQRLQQLGYQKPQLLGTEYTHLDFGRRPMRKDIGKRMLYRDGHMTGWSYKEITPEDLKFPVVYGDGKRSRLLATIGVTRGFGDHDLRAQTQSGSPVMIKPFLSPQPEVRVLDVEAEDISPCDVLIMATDGLWDVLSNEKVADLVETGLKLYEEADETRMKYRFVSIAQDLVMAARGKLCERTWRRADSSAATIDDISVMAVPILAYKNEYAEWKVSCQERKAKRRGEAAAAVAQVNSTGGNTVQAQILNGTPLVSQSEAESPGAESESRLNGSKFEDEVDLAAEVTAEEEKNEFQDAGAVINHEDDDEEEEEDEAVK